MNKFLVFPCIEQSEDDGYQGPVVSLASTSNLTFALFFPIAEEYANLINYMLKKEEVEGLDFQLMSVYQTMVDSWKAGDRYLSGIVMDIIYDVHAEEDIISPTIILSDSLGNVDAVLNVSFVHAVMLAAMERKELLVTNELLEKLLPMPEHDDEGNEETPEPKKDSKFPVDKQILEIARNIMNDKKKDSDDLDEDNSE